MIHELFRVVLRFPRYISCYIAESRFPLGQCTAIVVAWPTESTVHHQLNLTYI